MKRKLNFLYYDSYKDEYIIVDTPFSRFSDEYLEIRKGVHNGMYAFHFIRKDNDEVKGLTIWLMGRELEHLQCSNTFWECVNTYLKNYEFEDSRLFCRELPPKEYKKLFRKAKKEKKI